MLGFGDEKAFLRSNLAISQVYQLLFLHIRINMEFRGTSHLLVVMC